MYHRRIDKHIIKNMSYIFNKNILFMFIHAFQYLKTNNLFLAKYKHYI